MFFQTFFIYWSYNEPLYIGGSKASLWALPMSDDVLEIFTEFVSLSFSLSESAEIVGQLLTLQRWMHIITARIKGLGVQAQEAGDSLLQNTPIYTLL